MRLAQGKRYTGSKELKLRYDKKENPVMYYIPIFCVNLIYVP